MAPRPTALRMHDDDEDEETSEMNHKSDKNDMIYVNEKSGETDKTSENETVTKLPC